MAYTAWSVVFGEQPTASKWNQLGTNDAGFNNGTLLPIANSTSASVTTSETTASTSYTDLATTTDTITVTVGSNLKLVVGVYCGMNNSGANYCGMSFALSGANTLAANDNYAIAINGTNITRLGASWELTGLTAGSTTVKAKYNVSAGTGTFANRRIYAIVI